MSTLTLRRALLTAGLVAGCDSSPSTDTPGDGGGGGDDGDVDAGISVTGIDKVAAGEYVTAYQHEGRMYSVAGTYARRGAGPNSSAPLFPPVEVAFPQNVTIVDSAGGLHFTIAADSDGHLWEWGDIDSNPALANSDVPIQLTDDLVVGGRDRPRKPGFGRDGRDAAPGDHADVDRRADACRRTDRDRWPVLVRAHRRRCALCVGCVRAHRGRVPRLGLVPGGAAQARDQRRVATFRHAHHPHRCELGRQLRRALRRHVVGLGHEWPGPRR